MAAYVPFIIWIVSALVCFYIAKARKVKPNFMRRLIVVIFGPLAIPFVFFVKSENEQLKGSE